MLSLFSHVWLFATLWTVILRAPLSKGFSRQEYWGGLPCPPPRDLPDPGIKLAPLTSPALASGFFTTSTTWEAQNGDCNIYITMLLEALEKVPRKWLVCSPLPHEQYLFSLAVISFLFFFFWLLFLELIVNSGYQMSIYFHSLLWSFYQIGALLI